MKKKTYKILIVIIFLAGLSLLLYPFVANQWNNYRQKQLISDYDSIVSAEDAAGEIDYAAELEKARAYNEALLPSILPDSFAIAEATEGEDKASIHVLNETLCYEVDKISVVKPEETSGLAVEEGKDLVTLLTCTQYGVNTERLLVRGHRVEYVEQEVEAEKTLFSGISIHTNYLLWVIVGLLVTTAFIVVLYKKEQKLKKRRAEQAADGQEAPVVQDRTVTGDADTETEKKE